jgi:carbonic anhydrase/acetyltransferase-like protein (isoleucine patch superfamily)
MVVGPAASIEIGDSVSIGYGAAISAYERLEIGSGTSIGAFVIIMDTNFHRSGGQSVEHETRPVMIGRNCRLGSRVTLTRGAVVGDEAMVLAGSVVSTTIPAGVCAGGARAKVLAPLGSTEARWDNQSFMVPLQVMDFFGLDDPPQGAQILGEIPGWRAETGAQLCAEIADWHGVDLFMPHPTDRLDDLIVGVKQARRRR